MLQSSRRFDHREGGRAGAQRPPSLQTRLSVVYPGVTYAVLPAQTGHENASLVHLQNSDDLLFLKAGFQALVLVVGQGELQSGLSPWGKVTSTPRVRPIGD